MSVEESLEFASEPGRFNLRLGTLLRIRWIAILGQVIAVFVVWKVLGFDFNPVLCFALIVISTGLNAALAVRYPASRRLDYRASTLLLTYDIVQLGLLLFLTGGLQNPFSVLLLVPVVISATTLPVPTTLILGAVGVLTTTLLAFFHLPLPWFPGETLQLARIYVVGMWIAINSTMIFMAAYAFRVADESRKLSEALAATELVLQREQHLSSLDGLAAAAAHELGTPLATVTLVSKEMMRELETDSALFEDAKLLNSQAQRCREILQKLTSLSTQDDQHIGRIPFSALLEEVCEPHREFGIKLRTNMVSAGNEPLCRRNPGIIYGLGNLVENAVDHARNAVELSLEWNDTTISVSINDDGKGFQDETISRIGEPYISRRSARSDHKGLGLGLFIAKSLLERSGAVLSFGNHPAGGLSGAYAKVEWPREIIDVSQADLEEPGE